VNEDEIRAAFLKVLGQAAPEADLVALSPDARLRDELDIDSMDALDIALGLYEALGVDVPDRDYSKLDTINSAVAYLARRLQSG
jgi:acyl carrier protein